MRFVFPDGPKAEAKAKPNNPEVDAHASAEAGRTVSDWKDKALQYTGRGKTLRWLFDTWSEDDTPDRLPQLSPEEAEEALQELRKVRVGVDMHSSEYVKKRKWLESLLDT